MRSLKITEAEFQAQVIELLQHTHWKIYHTWKSIHSVAGFPDIIAIREGELLVIELKSAKGKLTEAQKLWLEAFQLTCARVFVWKAGNDDDWNEAVAVAVLQGKIIKGDR